MRTRPDETTDILLQGRVYTVDEAGYLTDPDTWTEEFARHVAEQEGITPTPLFWEVIVLWFVFWFVTFGCVVLVIIVGFVFRVLITLSWLLRSAKASTAS